MSIVTIDFLDLIYYHVLRRSVNTDRAQKGRMSPGFLHRNAHPEAADPTEYAGGLDLTSETIAGAWFNRYPFRK